MQVNCRHFNGYKPCGRSQICDALCPSRDIPKLHILVVHLEALGAVLRATSILPAIKKKYPNSHITWVTQRPADVLFQNNLFIDRVLTTTSDDLLSLSVLEFDIAFSLDKSLKAGGVLKLTRYDLLFGFEIDPASGAILPATAAAEELWEIGLSNQKKFFVNTKPETQLIAEALELEFDRDEYVLKLSADELKESFTRRSLWGTPSQYVVGINTGCSSTIAAKKLSIENHRHLIQKLLEVANVKVVLLGGKEDSENNKKIGEGLNVMQSSTNLGIRDGIISVDACDIIFSGDSFGMHIGIALSKWVVAWFGPTCAHEIDFYDRGLAVLTNASCSPCWKRSCQKNPMCYDLVPLDDIVSGIKEGFKWCQKNQKFSSSNPPFSEISYSPSP